MLRWKYKYIVAIDIGTSETAAFFCRSSEEDDETGIQDLEVFPRRPDNKSTLKTCYSLHEDDSIAYFGSPALCIPEVEVFDGQNMELFGARENDIANQEIKSRSGKQTITVEKAFKSILMHIKHVAMERIGLCFPNAYELECEIKWVLTVPAYWSDGARRFMQDVCFSCGLSQSAFSDQLCLAAESDCVVVQAHHATKQLLTKGTRYLVVDCGGSTVDVSAYAVEEQDPLRIAEIFPPLVIPFGSKMIDDNFVKLLGEICGPASPCVKNHEDLAQNLEDFINFKDRNSYGHGCALRISGISAATLKSRIAQFRTTSSEFAPTVSYREGRTRLKITKEGVMMLIMPVVDKIVKLVNDKLSQPDTNIDRIVLAGGFSANCILQQELLKRMAIEKDQLLLADPQPVLAVVKGALKYGILTMRQNSSVIVARKMKYTYGIKVLRPVDQDDVQTDATDGICRFYDPNMRQFVSPFVLKPIISSGDTMAVGDTVTKTFTSYHSDSRIFTVEIYATETAVDKKTWRSIDDGKFKTIQDEDVTLVHKMEIMDSQYDKFDIILQNHGSFGMSVFVGKHYPKDQRDDRDLYGPDFEMATFRDIDD